MILNLTVGTGTSMLTISQLDSVGNTHACGAFAFIGARSSKTSVYRGFLVAYHKIKWPIQNLNFKGA